MGVSTTQSDTEGSGGVEQRSAPLLAYTKKFEELFPYYLSIGMTYDEYWNMDCTLVRAYHRAARIKRDLANQQAWLQGMYFYEALCCVAPALNAMKPRKPTKYRTKPYEFKSQAEEKAEVVAKKQEAQDNKAKIMMEIFALNFNKRFEKNKGGEPIGK